MKHRGPTGVYGRKEGGRLMPGMGSFTGEGQHGARGGIE